MERIRRNSREWKAYLMASLKSYRFIDNSDLPGEAPWTPLEYAEKNKWAIMERDTAAREIRLTGANFIYKWGY